MFFKSKYIIVVNTIFDLLFNKSNTLNKTTIKRFTIFTGEVCFAVRIVKCHHSQDT